MMTASCLGLCGHRSEETGLDYERPSVCVGQRGRPRRPAREREAELWSKLPKVLPVAGGHPRRFREQ
ncbi:unnamed protein product [Nesidiocoris tenuis]|uniref:Uncharacterized protein n=2 Tax=Nesidiocoris tenuis TaxID=355587 RepID=A0A6H5G323_9HEMI|nr:Hypothetical protein NTJ_06726 [Nesidiocoris tenuis]CAA9996368.1 unnamed protein product [Nesidiocoris tenuis]